MVTQPLPPEDFQYKIENPAEAQGMPASSLQHDGGCSNDAHLVGAGLAS
jgi:hypothetical protein